MAVAVGRRHSTSLDCVCRPSNLLLATVVSVLFVGVTMLLAGAAHIVFAVQMKRRSHLLGLIAIGALYVSAGLVTFWNPVLASSVLTLLMALSRHRQLNGMWNSICDDGP